MPLASGVRLGPYEILAPAGAGGMGEVYRARDTRLDRIVAIKILPPQLCEKLNAKQRFEREARAISSLQHPHICTLYDIGHQDGADYLVMEYLEGETVAQRLAKGALPLEEVLKRGIEICAGLEEAHRRGILHRDLKPGNIMLTKTGAKLLDFGLAKPFEPVPIETLTSLPASSRALRGQDRGPLTTEGAIVGTLRYMSPEQLEGKGTDARSDIFALGSVLYEMTTGKPAFEGKSQASVIAAILEREPPPVSTLQPMSPPALDHVVRICLAKNPEERWQAAHDVKVQLQWIAVRDPQAVTSTPQNAATKRLAIIAWTIATVCVLVAIGFAVRLFSPTLQPAGAVRASLLPPQGSSFLPNNFALSPDGRQLAFVALGPDGKTTLWVRPLSTKSFQRLDDTEGAQLPFWSPDSRRIAFFAGGRLKTVDITGSAVQILCDAPVPFGGTWGRDGTIVFSGSLGRSLSRVSATGGAPSPATKPLEGSRQVERWPFFLPDGKHFLYFSTLNAPKQGRGNGIYVGSLDLGEPKLISSELTGYVLFASGYLLYVRDSTLLAQPFDTARLETTGPALPVSGQEVEQRQTFSASGISVSQNGELIFESAADSPSRLVWYDGSGKELGQLPELGYSYPALSRDGRFLAVSSDDQGNGQHFIRVYDLKREVSTRLTADGNDAYPTWSSDGSHITYGPTTSIGPIQEIPVNGSGPPQILLSAESRSVPCDWSPDGYLIFMALGVRKELRELPPLMLYSASDHKVTQFAEDGAEPKFSPDGKWVAYIGPTREIVVQPSVGPGARIQISNASGAQPRWSHDGRQIFYIQPDRKLMLVAFDPQRGLASAPRVLFQTRIVAPRLAWWQYDVAPDGRFLINSLPSNTSSPLTLLTGWVASLQQR